MRKCLLPILLLLVLFHASQAIAASEANLVFIFDASGSMWGQIDGKPKISIAKEAMDLIVNDLPENINVGLVAYGHRRKGDCDDVETLVPLGPLDAAAFLDKVNSLNPKGKTPMVRSIRKTADSIKHLEDETTILLVSDGEETCDPDPCGFVAELEKLGIKFVLHVVGFDVGGQTEEQLKCMAKAGGGEYFPAKDAGKLKEALTTVIKKTVEKNLKVSIFLNDKPIGGSVEVTNPATGERAGHRAISAPEPILMGIIPGTYTVTVADEWEQEGRPTLVFENVQINESEVREITANFGSGTLTIWTYRNGKPFKARTRLSTLDDQTVGGGYETTYPDKPAQYLLQPGKYRLMAEDSWGAGTQKELGIIDLAAGQTIEKKVSFDTGKLEVWTYKNGQPFHASVIIRDKNDKTMGGGWGTTYEDRPEIYTLEPGVYTVEAEDSWGDPVVKLKFGTVEVKAGETLNKICNFDSPPSQNQAPSAPTSMAPASTPPSGQVTQQVGTAGPPKQTERETVDQAQGTTAQTNPQDMQAMATQMQAQAEAQAAAAQADAMAQMQDALSGMNTRPDMPAPKQTERETVSTVGAPPTGPSRPVGAPATDADVEAQFAAMEARDTGGGLDGIDDSPEQGHNPYAGMSKEEMQAAFAKDMSMQGPSGSRLTYNPDEFKVGSPLTTRRHIDTLDNRLDTCEEKARAVGRNDILNRIENARGGLLYLAQKLKKRAPQDELQRLLDKLAQEVNAIQVSVAQGR